MTLYVFDPTQTTDQWEMYRKATRRDVLADQGWIECGTCDGLDRSCADCAHGMIPPDGMVYEAGHAMAKADPHAAGRFGEMARAALVAAARWEAPGE